MPFHRLVDLYAFGSLLNCMHIYGARIRSTQEQGQGNLALVDKEFQIAVIYVVVIMAMLHLATTAIRASGNKRVQLLKPRSNDLRSPGSDAENETRRSARSAGKLLALLVHGQLRRAVLLRRHLGRAILLRRHLRGGVRRVRRVVRLVLVGRGLDGVGLADGGAAGVRSARAAALVPLVPACRGGPPAPPPDQPRADGDRYHNNGDDHAHGDGGGSRRVGGGLGARRPCCRRRASCRAWRGGGVTGASYSYRTRACQLSCLHGMFRGGRDLHSDVGSSPAATPSAQ